MINMKCPICGKDLDLQNKQIGTSENGDPIFNEYAICHSCKKQWNLDKQRAKKIAAKKAAEEKAKAETEIKETKPILTYEDEEVTISITEEKEGAIPEGTTLSVTSVQKDTTEYTEVEEKLLQKA